MPISSISSTSTLSANPATLEQIDTTSPSSLTKNSLQKLKDALRSLVKILNRLTLAKEAIMRIFNAILNSILSKFAAKTPLPNATERLKKTPELLVKIFENLPLKGLKQVRLAGRVLEEAANVAIKNVKVHDTDALKGAIRTFGPGRVHVTFASDFRFPEDPADLAKLLSDTSVTGLKFDRCSGLTDAHLVAVFQQCTNLKAFSLVHDQHNQNITDSFLPYVPTTLQKLNLSYWDNLTDEKLSIALQRCENLEKLNLRYCKDIKGSCLEHIPVTLKILAVSSCKEFTEEYLIVALQRCRDLKELNFWKSGRVLTGIFLQYLPSTVEILKVSDCGWSPDAGLGTGLQQCRNLKELNLRDCGETVMESVLQHLSPAITILELSYCQGLTDENLGTALQRYINLEKLRLSSCYGIRGHALQHIPSTVKIVEIFRMNTIVDVPTMAFEQCKNLEILSFQSCSKIARSRFLRHLSPTVKRLEMVGFSRLAEEHLTTALRRCNGLEVLFVISCKHITGRFLQHIPPTVKRLEMSGNPYNGRGDGDYLTDMHLMELQRCTNLEELALSYYQYVTGRFLPYVCATVKRLTISECNGITDRHFSAALQQSTNLEYLNLHFNDRNTSSFLEYSPITLKELHLSGFRTLSDEILGIVLQRSKNLGKLNLYACDFIYGSFLHYASATLKNLRVSNCKNFTVVREKYPKLTWY